jgi:hypothetical protein
MRRALGRLASLRLTLAAILWLATAVVVGTRTDSTMAWIVPPLLLLSFNLVAALATNPRLRRHGGLLGFHLCLLVLLVLAAWRELAYFHGRIEIVEGGGFDPAQLQVRNRGPWHDLDLPAGLFVQEAISVEYAPGMLRGRTSSRVRLADDQMATIGDDRPLVADRYRFYTTSNKGFAALFTWTGADGTGVRGAVHLPSYPLLAGSQVNEWRLPTGAVAEVRMANPGPDEQSAWRLDRSHAAERISVGIGDRVSQLMPGQSLGLPGGELRFEGLRMWMGYEVRFEPVLPWLFMTALLGVAFLAWHFRRRFGFGPPVPARGRMLEPGL